MADKKQFDDIAPPAADAASDLDPFAELTRIMGFDPRKPAEPAAPTMQDDADFAAALEEVDAPAAAPVSALSHDAVARQIEAASIPQEPAEDFGIDLERELLGDMLAAGEPAMAVAEPLADVVASADESSDAADPQFDAAFASDITMEDAVASAPADIEDLNSDVDALNAAFAEAELETAAPVAAELEEAIVAELANATVSADDTEIDDLDFDDLDFGDIEDAIGREMEQALTAGAVAAAPTAELSHDDDLSAALEDAFEDDFDLKADVPAPVLAEAPAPKVAEGLADVDMDFDAGLDWSELDTREAAPVARASAEQAFTLGDDTDDLIAALDAASAKHTPGERAEMPAASNEDPFSALAKMAERYHTTNTQDDWRQPVRTPQQPRAAAPEVETTEMFDQAFSMADDLDLPEIAYDEPVKATNDLDLEFDRLLNEMSRGDAPAARPVTPVAATTTPRYEPREPIASHVETRQTDDYGFESVFAQGEVDDHALAQDLGSFEYDEEDDDDTQPQAPYRAHDSGHGRRGMMIAAIVGGIAVLGGLGALAMSWGESGGAPALVQADTSPIKVRPENPGGTSVPNQDSTVYDTASRSGSPEQPVQERLVSATEEPLEIPQPNDEEADEIASMAKGEDRVEPGQADESAAQDPIAVAPRKVRTMIVKPDGTLVPVEEPAQEATDATPTPASAEPTVEDIAAASVGEPEQITTGATQPTQPAAEPVAAAPAPGGWSVQIASQPSEDGANKSMKSMGQRYASAIGDRGMHVVKAEVAGKGTYWRVRVAAASRDDAVNVCSDLKSAGGSCFVTR